MRGYIPTWNTGPLMLGNDSGLAVMSPAQQAAEGMAIRELVIQ